MKYLLIGLVVMIVVFVVFVELVKLMDVVFIDGVVDVLFFGMLGDLVFGVEIMNKGVGNCIVCYQVFVLSYLVFYGEIGLLFDGVVDCWFVLELCGIVVNVKVMFEGSMMLLFYKIEGFICFGDVYIGDVYGDGEVQLFLMV